MVKRGRGDWWEPKENLQLILELHEPLDFALFRILVQVGGMEGLKMMKHPWIEVPLLALAVLGTIIVLVCRLTIKVTTTDKDGKSEVGPRGIGVRMIQLIAVLILVPVIAILAIEGYLTGEGAGTIMGAIVGYALGGITAAVPKT